MYTYRKVEVKIFFIHRYYENEHVHDDYANLIVYVHLYIRRYIVKENAYVCSILMRTYHGADC